MPPAAAEPEGDEATHQYRVEAGSASSPTAPGEPAACSTPATSIPAGWGSSPPTVCPLGYGGLVQLPRPDGNGTMTVHCTILRCREAAPGWFEGSVYFNREQPHARARPSAKRAEDADAGGVKGYVRRDWDGRAAH